MTKELSITIRIYSYNLFLNDRSKSVDVSYHMLQMLNVLTSYVLKLVLY
jgi:hypothetical protein